MRNDEAIVTIALGAQQLALLRTYRSQNWSSYAERHGYDVICIEQALDGSAHARPRAPVSQKCPILGQPFASRYERLVWMDADILINPTARCVVEGVRPDRVGAVDEYSTPSCELYRQALHRLYRHREATGTPFARDETATEDYAAYGLPSATTGSSRPG